MTTPEALRDEGMEAAENAADPRLMLMVDAAIERAIDSGRPFSANDIRAQFPVVASGLVGARVKAASMRKEPAVEKVGEVGSTLSSTHAKKIAVWQGVAS